MIPRTTHLLSALLAALSAAVGPGALAQDPRAEQVETEAPPAADRFRVVAAQRFGVQAKSTQLGRIEGPILLMDGNLTLYVASALLELDGEKEVIAPESGLYTIKLKQRRFEGSSEFYGVAMTTDMDRF